MESAERGRTYQGIIFDAVCVAVLIAYFLHFALPALRGGFREDEMGNIGICWCAGIAFRKYRILEAISLSGRRPLRSASLSLSTRRRSLLSAALSLLRPGSSSLSNRPDHHSRCIHSPGLLLEPASRLLALDRFHCCPRSLLPPAACRPGVYWCVYL